MAWNGAGVVTRTDGVRTGADVFQQQAEQSVDVRADLMDAHENDIVAAIQATMPRNGEAPATGNWDMAGFRQTGLGTGVNAGDSVSLGQVQAGRFLWGGTSGGNNALTISLSPAITSYTDGLEVWWRKGDTDNTDDMTLNVNGLGAKSLMKAINVQMPPGAAKAHAIMGARYILAADDFVVIAGVTDMVLRAALTTTSGTTKDFTDIPAGAKRITVMFNGVSTDGTQSILVQLGIASGFVTTGYLGGSGTFKSLGTTTSTLASTTGFAVDVASSGSWLLYGHLVLTKISGNTWISSGHFYTEVSSDPRCSICAGSIALAGALTQLRVTSASTPDDFDAGAVSILVEAG